MKSKQETGIILITILLISSFIFLFNVNPSINTSEEIINSPLSEFDISWDLKDVISGSGNNASIDLFCENETVYSNFLIQNSFLDFDHKRNLTLPSIPGYKIYKVNVTLDENKKITAVDDYYSITVNTSTSTTVQGGGFPNFEAAGQEFSIPYRAYLNNASIYMAISGLVAGNNGSIQLRNSSAAGPILNSQVIPVVSLGVPTWHNFTYSLILNGPGQPYEIIINGSNLALARQYFWYRPATGSVPLDADAKIWTLGWADAQYNFTLIYNHLPINKTGTLPRNFTAEEISLKINNAAIGNDNTIVVEDTDIQQLEFSTNISSRLNSMKLRIYYIKENQSVQTTYNAVVNQAAINWNVTVNIPFVANGIEGTYGLNITIPSDWVVQTILNGSPLSTYDSSNWIQSNTLVTIKNASSGSDPWVLNCTAPNYLTQLTVETKIGPTTYVNITDSLIVNITETIRVNGSLTSASINSGDGNLTIFDPSDTANYSQVEDLNPPANGLITFNDWIIANNATTNGTYTIQVIWFNGTEVGIRNILLTVIHHTTSVLYVEGQLKTATNPVVAWFSGVDNTINLTVFYNRTFQPTGISTLLAYYNIVNETGGEWQAWTDMEKETLGTGLYNITLDIGSWLNGRYFIGINLSLGGYLPQIRNITIDLVYNTSIALIEPATIPLTTIFPENITIAVDYTRIGVGIIPDGTVNYTINGANPRTISYNGTLYAIQLNSTDLGVGTYNITITATKFGHFSRWVSFNWTIQTCSTNYTVYVNGSWAEKEFYYGQMMKVTVDFDDTDHTVHIYNADIKITLLGQYTLQLSYEGNGNYSVVLDSTNQSAGFWNLSIDIEKANYVNHTTSLELFARYNSTLEWISAPPDDIRPGEILTISVRLNRTGFGALAGQNVTFIISINSVAENHTYTTNALGIVTWQETILSSYTTYSIRVVYDGNETDFVATALLEGITIKTGGFLEEYWWVFVLLAVGVVVGAVVVRSRRKTKIAKEAAKKEIITSFQDVTKILHIVVIHKGTGADIFDYRIQERLDPTLLAGFIQAVKEFGTQLDQEGP